MCDVGGDPPCLVAGEEVCSERRGRRSAIPQAGARASQVSSTPQSRSLVQQSPWLGPRWGCPPLPQVSRRRLRRRNLRRSGRVRRCCGSRGYPSSLANAAAVQAVLQCSPRCGGPRRGRAMCLRLRACASFARGLRIARRGNGDGLARWRARRRQAHYRQPPRGAIIT